MMCMYMHMYKHVHKYMYTHIYKYMCVYVCVCVCVFVRVRARFIRDNDKSLRRYAPIFFDEKGENREEKRRKESQNIIER